MGGSMTHLPVLTCRPNTHYTEYLIGDHYFLAYLDSGRVGGWAYLDHLLRKRWLGPEVPEWEEI